ncbi:MAG: FHA domain-containing protein [Deltaproteobacteria bacterium]|nr:FHA domain-containing protein [Deltaproteobacteria bacterium]
MPLRLNVRMEIPGKEAREFLYEFDQDVVTLGRDSHNDIQIPLTTVSRQHARIVQENGEYFIEDLRSTHGTLHNHRALGQGGKKLLRDGDLVQVMHFKIQFQRVADKPLEFASSEKTEQLARRMVQEVLASMGEATEQPYLRVMNGPDEGKRFELSDAIAEVVIGRASECDFVVNDANISRRHAMVRKDWGGITIEDLGSKNGVVINDRKIDGATALQDRDEIMLGQVRLTFIDPTASLIHALDDIPNFDDRETVAAGGNGESEGDEDESAEGEEQGEEEVEAEPEPGAEEGAPADDQAAFGDQMAALEHEQTAGVPEEPINVPGPKTDIIILIAVLVLVVGLAAALAIYLLL